jgi:aminoglycoside phosphotransferase (APT) family kinase protein
MSQVALTVEARAPELVAEQPTLWEFVTATGLQSLVCAPSKDPNAKVMVLLVSPESGEAVLAVKAPTTAAAEDAVEAEAGILQQLAARPLGPLAGTIPRLVEVVEFEQRRAAVMSALPGRPLSTASQTRGHARDARAVTADFHAAGEWLAQLQRATAGNPAPVDMSSGVVSRLRERFAHDPALAADLERLADVHGRLSESRAPRTVVHGDFWAGNILVSDGRVTGVVDWEAASVSGEPVRDLARFANMYALYLDRGVRRGRRVPGHAGLVAGEWGAGIDYALHGDGWFPSLYREFLRDGLTRLGADPARWRDAALAGIVEVAALTDHDDFARFHLELFRRLASSEAVQ